LSRRRFTIDDARWARACEYAEATNRTPSELICEALDQIEARYPKHAKINETDEDRIITRIMAKLALQVPAGTFKGNSRAIREAS